MNRWIIAGVPITFWMRQAVIYSQYFLSRRLDTGTVLGWRRASGQHKLDSFDEEEYRGWLAFWGINRQLTLLTFEGAVMALPGSQRNVQELVAEFYLPLYRYAFRLSGTAVDAEDLTQEAFCKAQLQLAQLRDVQRVKAWLFSILRNAYLHRVRAERQRRCLSLDQLPDLPEAAAEPLPEIEPQRLQEALAELDEGFRTPVILYYFEEFSYREIAEQMELPIGTVMSRLARAKAYLKARLLAQPALADTPRRTRDGL